MTKQTKQQKLPTDDKQQEKVYTRIQNKKSERIFHFNPIMSAPGDYYPLLLC